MTDTVALDLGLRHDAPLTRVERPPLWLRVAPFLSPGSGDLARDKRHRIPIRCYVGPNASGKTMFAVRDILPSLDAGRMVYSTVPLLDASTGLEHPNYRKFDDWHQLWNDGCDFLADEISAIAASRDHNNLHSDVINRLHQLRKTDQTFSWTAPSWKRADTALREVTWVVTECRGYWPDNRTANADAILWAPRRLFRANTYDMKEFDEWSAGKREGARPDVREWFSGVGSREFRSYDTLAAVDRISGYDPRACDECGKPKRQEYCKGHDFGGAPPRRRPQLAEL